MMAVRLTTIDDGDRVQRRRRYRSRRERAISGTFRDIGTVYELRVSDVSGFVTHARVNWASGRRSTIHVFKLEKVA